MKINTMRVKLTGISPILGSVTNDKEIYSKFFTSKARDDVKVKKVEGDEVVETNITERDMATMDVESVKEASNEAEEKTTGFYRDPKTGNLILKPYQIKGFFKGAAKALKDQIKLASYVSKIDNFVFIEESVIPFTRNGEVITEPDGFLERPLRAETMQGPRVTLARSEMLEEGWEVEFTIKVIENNGTKQSNALNMDMIRDLLDYGQLKGLLQWRNGGYGSFKYEAIW